MVYFLFIREKRWEKIFNPCYEYCYLRLGKQYDSDCDNKCEYANAIKEKKELEKTIYAKEETKPTCESLIFKKPLFLKKEKVITEFCLKHEFTNSRTSIYENKDVRFCFDKKIIRVLLYDSSNKELRNRIQDYFYEKRWK